MSTIPTYDAVVPITYDDPDPSVPPGTKKTKWHKIGVAWEGTKENPDIISVSLDSLPFQGRFYLIVPVDPPVRRGAPPKKWQRSAEPSKEPIK
jgi:hypothetical protein